MPKWSRARVSRCSWRSQIARPNMPLKRSNASGPHCANAWSTTSVSESVAKVRPRACELGAQVEVVVDLAVVGDRVPPVRGVHRLLAVRDVDDRQPTVREPAGAVGHDAVAVGPPVLLAGVHALEERRVGVESVVAGDAAHAWVGPNVLGGRCSRHPVGMPSSKPATDAVPVRFRRLPARARPGPSQLSRMEREPSGRAPERLWCSGEGSGIGRESWERGRRGWGQAGRWASSQRMRSAVTSSRLVSLKISCRAPG